jgi:hypothetical protein
VPYHDNFWITAGTAAPVIALAAVVGLTEGFKKDSHIIRLRATAGHASWRAVHGPRANTLTWLVLLIAFLNVGGQAFVLQAALMSLQDSKNELSPSTATLVLYWGVLAVGLTVCLMAGLARAVGQIEEALKGGPKDTRAAQRKGGTT